MNALVRYQNPLSTLSDLIDGFFGDNVFSLRDREIVRTSWPRVDIVEEEKRYLVRADLPGMEKENIRITVENGVLTISGEKREEHREGKRDTYRYLERRYGSFSRSFNLPDHVDEKNIEASYKNGVLELRIQKTEKALPRQIEVKVD